MLTRALIVVLAILNLGVACWWLLREAPQKPAPAPQPAGVAELRWVPGGVDAAEAADAHCCRTCCAADGSRTGREDGCGSHAGARRPGQAGDCQAAGG
ncbi:hypothetical protein NDR96_20130 [Stenotrophomonas maltophilia]|nr:hypothetical protein NDR96_20130 [Stenotrophomonas maltophilia]